mmetsp:Transcript_12136/g.28961  ORF Transcript_12136/g.28961 Transcript_12136/m.28961 type:complete len:280 (-) Transcript_12136:158-997(-)|eukprot:CAMPEP_0182835170 /NCGR_PEP_ID=MMETSP0006_2-20121128/21349_1 /TAXON_ID=97485 /ORGANISM="Prymnesium parvum, Strain Texoma1" /LENGTH=279 /DNA_ID=CAMNT_0024963553 /DNA_START=17 /DNA_END=856 /DNA_ORIENTATION=+
MTETHWPLHDPSNAAANWSERKTADGRRFFYNRATKERVWKRPAVLASDAGKETRRTPADRSQSVESRARTTCDEGGGERGRVTSKGNSTGPSGRQHRALDDESLYPPSFAQDFSNEEQGEEFKPAIKSFVIKEQTAHPTTIANPDELRTAVANLALAMPAAAGGSRRRQRPLRSAVQAQQCEAMAVKSSVSVSMVQSDMMSVGAESKPKAVVASSRAPAHDVQRGSAAPSRDEGTTRAASQDRASPDSLSPESVHRASRSVPPAECKHSEPAADDEWL